MTLVSGLLCYDLFGPLIKKRTPQNLSCPLSSLASYNMALWSMLAPLTVKSTCSLPSHHLHPTPFQFVPLQVRVIVAFTWKPRLTDLTLMYGCHSGQKQTKGSGSMLALNKPASFVGSLCHLKMFSCHNPLWFESIIPVWIGSHHLSFSLFHWRIQTQLWSPYASSAQQGLLLSCSDFKVKRLISSGPWKTPAPSHIQLYIPFE